MTPIFKFRNMGGLILFILCMTILSSCSNFVENKEDRVLRIGVPSQYDSTLESSIRQQYINLFAIKNPHIKIELIFMEPELEEDEEIVYQFLRADPAPDVIISNSYVFSELVENNSIQLLEPYLAQSDLNIEEMVPSVIGYLEELGDGRLYGMAPEFSSKVLIYNKELFSTAEVEEPHDGMTWDEIFALAQRIHGGAGDDQIIGFSFDFNVKWFTMMQAIPYIKQLDLHVLNAGGTYMSVATEDWAKIWKQLIEYYHKDAFSHEDNFQLSPGALRGGGGSGNVFLSGRGAMTLINYWELQRVKEQNWRAEAMDGYDDIHWDVVTMPVHPEARDIGGEVFIPRLFSINAVAENPEDAWELIEYIHSEEWASIKHQGLVDSMVIYPVYIEEQVGTEHNAKAFYQLLSPPMQVIDQYILTNEGSIGFIDSIGTQKFKKVVKGSKTIAEALAEWQEAGNELLQEMLKEE